MRLSCPSTFQCDSKQTGRLYKLLGPELFEAVQRAFGGKRVWIPKPGARLPCDVCSRRNQCIRTWSKKGVPVAKISKHLGISPKSAYRIIGER